MGHFVEDGFVGWKAGGDNAYAELDVGDCRTRDVRPYCIR